MRRRDVTRTILGLAVAARAGVALAADATEPTQRELRAFQLRCLKIGRELSPAMNLSAPADDPEVLRSGEVEFGLQNLRANFLLSDRSDATLKDLVKRLLALAPMPDRPFSFEEARSKLLPQLMSADYVAMGADVHFPFGDGLLVGIVINQEKNYRYVGQKDLTQWQQKKEALLSIAGENLDRLSQSIPMESSTNPTARFIAIEVKDGFDAARILIPSLRAFIGTQLKLPFLFGVPNRDFLICWSRDNSAEFHAFTRNKIAEDYRTQPYGLSSRVFEVTSENKIRLTQD